MKKTYAFSTYVNSDNHKKFDLHVYKHSVRHFLWIEINIFRQIYECKEYDFFINYTKIWEYENSITRIIENYQREQYDQCAEIQNMFHNEFDGFMGVDDNKKKEINRMKTIDKIVN